MSCRILAVAVGIVILLCSAVALARPHQGPDSIVQWQEELELSDEQVNELQSLRYEFRLEEIDRRAELERAELDLEREFSDVDVDESRALALFDDVTQARTSLAKVHFRKRLAIQKVLTPEQGSTLRELIKDRRPGHRVPRSRR